jgi:hypothetical protein
MRDHSHKDSAMRHGHISRISAKALLAIVGLGLAGACADNVAPTSVVSAKKIPAQYNIVLGTESFYYTPEDGAIQRIGDHMIVIPADGICDPETSGYGRGTWDLPCDPVNHSILITATSYADDQGRPYVDFEPALRFVPTKETMLYLKDGYRDTPDQLAIYYCADLVCENEVESDPSLATHRVGKTSMMGRRLKHFSGYNIAAWEECLFPGVVELLESGSLFCNIPDDNFMNRSGYILASGLAKPSTGVGTFGRRKKGNEQK